ncbi:sensor domain-containing protein [Bacillus sp. FJAT-45350]|uniref:sensor domain-containing protein n=1 Tax=Bacillus sp. FJAT-45350 TaxID=2011014 RepID=UPI000BB82ABC|nr:bifunctional diguanylate cyclase/phosphodiesterase [Bacillus sp. FJAT-45350]
MGEYKQKLLKWYDNQKNYFQSLIEYHPDAVFLLDQMGDFQSVNKACESITHYDQRVLLESSFFSLFCPESLKTVEKYFSLAQNGTAQQYETELITKSGHKIEAHISNIPIVVNEEVVGIYGVVKDVTDQHKIETKLRESEQQYFSLFHFNTNAIFVLSREGQFERVNPAAVRLTGFSESELTTMTFHSLLEKKSVQTISRLVVKAIKGQAQTFEIPINHKENKKVILNVTVVPNIIDGQVRGTIGIAQDVTKKRIVEEKVAKMANEDVLTGLPNRRLFIKALEDSIEKANRKNEKLAILFIDIDRFKIINDTLGHSFGDEALIEITRRLNDCLDGQALLARMGGDEFTLLIPSVNLNEEVCEVAERILGKVSQPLEVEGYEFTMTTSIGIAIFPDSGSNAETLIKCADAAMYRAKAQGTDRYQLYSTDMNRGFYEWFQVENDLRRALEREEFELYYQPQFLTSEQKVIGVEVLVRWQHPEHGLVPPGKFISIAEETGLIVPIGEWVLRNACKQMKEWLDKGYPNIQISVNLSLRQFMQKNIVQVVEKALTDSQLPPEYLDLEITESVTIDLSRTMTILEKLKELGVKISLDDFGTGYSSLQYLSEFPIDELKIDQSFVNNIGIKENSKAIIAMIINLGHLLNLEVIAEGVETKEQVEFLLDKGCDKVQGYFYSRPLSTIDYERVMKKFKQ